MRLLKYHERWGYGALFRYDLVFMDVQMPVMDGIEATTQLIAGLTLLAAASATSTIELTTACALKEALFTAPSVLSNIPEVEEVLSRAIVSMWFS